jgi:hypothetical protein
MHIIKISNNALPVPQKTHCPQYKDQLSVLRERTARYCENHMEHVNTILGQNGKILNSKRVVYSVKTVVNGAEKGGRIFTIMKG